MNEPISVTLNKEIGFGARLGLNSGIALAVPFGLVLASIVILIVDEGMQEDTLLAFPAVSMVLSQIFLGKNFVLLYLQKIRRSAEISIETPQNEVSLYRK